jgi:2-amino-4-hydroxy-6-hydroxymethyldihydropteridine diphosphokinase
MITGYISIGSNIDREIHIPSALAVLRGLYGNLQLSSIYQTAAVGFEGPEFHNLVVAFAADLTPKQVAKQLKQIELDHGRQADAPKFAPRTLDLDLILYGDQVISDGRLRIPREDIERYAFVLEPLAEIAAEAVHPVNGKTYRQLWAEFDKQGLQQLKVLPSWLSDKQAAATING